MSEHARLITVAFCLALHAGCGGPTVPPEASNVPFHVVPEASTMVSGFREAAQFVVRDQVGWEQFWDEFLEGRPPTRYPTVPIPTIDFDTHVVIAAARGVDSPWYTVLIEEVLQSEGRLYVVVQDIRLGGGFTPDSSAICVFTGMTRTPVATVAVESRLDDVQFVNRKSTEQCPWDSVYTIPD